MIVEINGAPATLSPAATVADAVVAAGADLEGRGVAAAVAGEVVPRALWRERELSEGDQVEVVHAVQGG